MASVEKPRIGVSGPERGGAAAWLCTAAVLRWAGARPVRITPKRPCEIESLDGLVLGGGADIAPELYGEEPVPLQELRAAHRSRLAFVVSLLLAPLIYLLRRMLSTGMHVRGDKARDALESALIQQAFKRRLPILGICRGAQLLNVQCGGTLHQELSTFYAETPQAHSIWPYKAVNLAPDSRLASIVGDLQCRVNSLHRQAVNRLAGNFRAVAHEPNDVVQAIEHRDREFVIGVQWHPEYLPYRAEQRALFSHLVEQARTCLKRDQ
ncbi:hypothetical protein CAI21_15515 [Alkalilimnicola ehrlichii]|uniref:Uncharacterized protein n=1 Tax=Alkalilimnicola ehrlichii TaxID=351052 RepID=A0A3E0WPL9_9GAMM|nr:type 1 glutamine amidotransferase [Alkalilimnicola ehrlichii]RFA26973.1 hypothetical protein CAI21_15515 [Alkalilimnicola ehrlichii]RFA34091.1 hypothetical protein CAL65_15650 [Alkalilimnicola ehrlichii]